MADPTVRVRAFSTYKTDRKRMEYVIKSGTALVINALVAVDSADGKVTFAASDASTFPCGIVIGGADGNDENLTGNAGGTVSAICEGGIILENVSVAGVAAITDVGTMVYADDGQTLTITPNASLPTGVIVRWRSATYCDVYLYDVVESATAQYLN